VVGEEIVAAGALSDAQVRKELGEEKRAKVHEHEALHRVLTGPGRWITIYANAGHTFMSVDGVWFDTAGRSGPYASRWLVATPPLAGYSVRHPPGF
jgi:hypothetical protein